VKETKGETYVPAAQPEKEAQPRVSRADENQERQNNTETPARQGQKAPGGVTRGQFRFSKKDRLRLSREFVTVLKKGRRHRGACCDFVSLPNGLDRSRLGLDVSRKTGKAWYRNRLRRFIREVFRLNRSLLRCNMDLVVRMRPHDNRLIYKDIEKDFKEFAAKRLES